MVERKEGEASSQGADAITLATRNPVLDQGSVIYTTRMLMTTSTTAQLFGEVLPTPSKDDKSVFLESWK